MDMSPVSVRVLAHFTPGDKVRKQIAAEADWLDVHFVAEDDDDAFHRELPEADVLWHVLRPLSGADLEKAAKLKLVQKLDCAKKQLFFLISCVQSGSIRASRQSGQALLE